MIFSPSQLEVIAGDNIQITFSNEFQINIVCVNEDHCLIRYGFINKPAIMADKSVDAENLPEYIKNIIETLVNTQNAKLVGLKRTKKKQSAYRAIMETLL